MHVEPKRLIVQTWRSVNWLADSIDSVLILSFWPEAAGGRVELIHANVCDADFAGVSHGWEKHDSARRARKSGTGRFGVGRFLDERMH